MNTSAARSDTPGVTRMSIDSSAAAAAAELGTYFAEPANYSHAANVAASTAPELVLERLPNGEYGWLRSEDRAEPDDALWIVGQRGKDYLARDRAMQALFGSPGQA